MRNLVTWSWNWLPNFRIISKRFISFKLKTGKIAFERNVSRGIRGSFETSVPKSEVLSQVSQPAEADWTASTWLYPLLQRVCSHPPSFLRFRLDALKSYDLLIKISSYHPILLQISFIWCPPTQWIFQWISPSKFCMLSSSALIIPDFQYV
jgi:hypothetical protein